MAQKNTTEKEQSAEAKAPAFIAWHVSGEGKKSYWTRIGAAWKHKDGEGLNLQLDLVPLAGGRIVLRSPKDEDKQDQPGEGA